MYHHRLRLQPILAQETSPTQHHRHKTTSRMARCQIQSVHQSPEMVGLARTPATTSTSLPKAIVSTTVRNGGEVRVANHSGRRLRSYHSNRLRSSTDVYGTGVLAVSLANVTDIPSATPIAPYKKSTSPHSRNMTSLRQPWLPSTR